MAGFVRYPWFPYLFACCIPLTFYSHNQAAFALTETWRSIIVFVLVAAAMIAVLRGLARDRAMAHVLATVPILGLWLLGIGWQLYAMLAILVVAVAATRHRSFPIPLLPPINALALGVLFMPLATIAQVEVATRSSIGPKLEVSPFSALRFREMRIGRPDIYHIVLDAYAGSTTLAEDLGFDNSGFFGELRDLGFIVGESVTVPYNETVHTMSAVFLGEYLRPGEFPIDSQFAPELRSTLGSLIPNAPVHDILRTNGYALLYTDVGHQFLRFPYDGVVLHATTAPHANMFEQHLAWALQLDLLMPGLLKAVPADPLFVAVTGAFSHDLSRFGTPRFMYQHVLAPHTPFNIDRHGRMTTDYPAFFSTSEGDAVVRGDPILRDMYVRGYLEKLRFVNARVLAQVRQLIALPGRKVIMLHGDHGSGAWYFLNDADKSCIRERFTTFLAVFSDDPALRERFRWVAQPDASPINLYRSLLGHLLQHDLQPLPPRLYFVNKATPDLIEPIESRRLGLSCHVH